MPIVPIPIPGNGITHQLQEIYVGTDSPIEIQFTAEGVFWRDPNGATFTGKIFQGYVDEGDAYVNFTPSIPVDVLWKFLPSDGSPEIRGKIHVQDSGDSGDGDDSAPPGRDGGN